MNPTGSAPDGDQAQQEGADKAAPIRLHARQVRLQPHIRSGYLLSGRWGVRLERGLRSHDRLPSRAHRMECWRCVFVTNCGANSKLASVLFVTFRGSLLIFVSDIIRNSVNNKKFEQIVGGFRMRSPLQNCVVLHFLLCPHHSSRKDPSPMIQNTQPDRKQESHTIPTQSESADELTTAPILQCWGSLSSWRATPSQWRCAQCKLALKLQASLSGNT